MKINDKLKLAMARYYHNQDSQYTYRSIDGTSKELKEFNPNAVKWNKVEDLANILNYAKRAGFLFQHHSFLVPGVRPRDGSPWADKTPGTFWFSKGKHVIECNKTNYLNGGVKSLIKKKK